MCQVSKDNDGENFHGLFDMPLRASSVRYVVCFSYRIFYFLYSISVLSFGFSRVTIFVAQQVCLDC